MRRRVWFRLFSALAAAWSFSRGIGTYRSFATGVAATQLRRRTRRSRWLFEEHPALRRRRRPRRGDLGLGHSAPPCGDRGYEPETPAQTAGLALLGPRSCRRRTESTTRRHTRRPSRQMTPPSTYGSRL